MLPDFLVVGPLGLFGVFANEVDPDVLENRRFGLVAPPVLRCLVHARFLLILAPFYLIKNGKVGAQCLSSKSNGNVLKILILFLFLWIK